MISSVKRVAIYCAPLTLVGVDGNRSVLLQLGACRRWLASTHPHSTAVEFIDHEPATIDDRSELRRLIATAANGSLDLVVVRTRRHLGRPPTAARRTIEGLSSHGVEVVSVRPDATEAAAKAISEHLVPSTPAACWQPGASQPPLSRSYSLALRRRVAAREESR